MAPLYSTMLLSAVVSMLMRGPDLVSTSRPSTVKVPPRPEAGRPASGTEIVAAEMSVPCGPIVTSPVSAVPWSTIRVWLVSRVPEVIKKAEARITASIRITAAGSAAISRAKVDGEPGARSVPHSPPAVRVCDCPTARIRPPLPAVMVMASGAIFRLLWPGTAPTAPV